LSFGNMLAVVRRHQRHDFAMMDHSMGVWGDFFPDILGAADPEDIIVKYTYEPDYQQLLTVSDPRVTASADPRFAESAAYYDQLTQYEYSALSAKTLSRIRHPDTTYPSPLPSGATGLTNTVEQYLVHDPNGRLTRSADAEGNILESSYVQGGPADPTTGYLESTTRDAAGVQLRTGYEPSAVGLQVGVTNPRGVGTGFVVNQLNQVVERTTGGPGYTALLLRRERSPRAPGDGQRR